MRIDSSRATGVTGETAATGSSGANDTPRPSGLQFASTERPRRALAPALMNLRARLAQTFARAGLVRHASAGGTSRASEPRSTLLSGLSPQSPVQAAIARSGPGIGERIADMKAYLDELYAAHAANIELPSGKCRDPQFADLLVAVENARDPQLNLSTHTIDFKRLVHGGAPAAVDNLARRIAAAMQTSDDWHAIVSIDDHAVALSAKHDPAQPMHVSLVIVDSTNGHFSTDDWTHVTRALAHRLNGALQHAGKARDAKVWLTCLNTSVQKTSDGSTIFAVAAAREMPGDPGIDQIHAQALSEAQEQSGPYAARVASGDRVLGPRFFKHMTLESGMRALLKLRPELKDEPVNQQEEALHERQAAHLGVHRPSFGLPYVYSGSYEQKRLNMYEQAIQHVELAAAPALLAARVEQMRDYVSDLKRAFKGKAPPPVPREAEFLDLLAAVENTRDPQLRLSAHKIELAKLAVQDRDVISELSSFLAQGVQSGADWHATLDFDGHHAALSVRHDPQNTAHVSLVVLGIGQSPLSDEHWQNLSIMLSLQLHDMLQASGETRSRKIWLTHVDLPTQPGTADGALLALLAATGMKGDARIASAHRDALDEADSAPEPFAAGIRGDTRSPGLAAEVAADPAATEPLSDAELLDERIQMYRTAIDYFERSLQPFHLADR